MLSILFTKYKILVILLNSIIFEIYWYSVKRSIHDINLKFSNCTQVSWVLLVELQNICHLWIRACMNNYFLSTDYMSGINLFARIK